MDLLKESLGHPSDPSKRTTTKKTRSQLSKRSKRGRENNSLLEPLLSSSTNDVNDNIELGSMNSDDDDNEDQNEQKITSSRHILRSRHLKSNSTPVAHGGGSIVIVEKPIRPNETLQAFSIRYRVPVSQLKRLNNLQNDQDFYALSYCRVPVRRFGLLHEPTSSETVVNLNEQTINGTLPVTNSTQQNHHAFLSAMDKDLAAMRTIVQQWTEKPLITPNSPSSPTKMIIRSTSKPLSELNCDGADCGCKLWHIIGFIILIALLVPLIYIYLFLVSPTELMDHHSS